MNSKKQIGSSLIEVLISLVLMAIGASAYLTLHAKSMSWQQRSQQEYLNELETYNAKQ